MKYSKLIVLLLGLMLLIVAGCEREISPGAEFTDNSDENCFTCHDGLLDQAQGEWVNSIHASGANIDYTNRGGSDCTMCHNQQGFIQFQLTGVLPDEPFDQVSAIGCFTCHNPHENGDMTLRTMAPVTLMNNVVFDHNEGNLCVACHHSRKSADDITADQSVNRYWGPHHGPQGDMLAGTNGWEFPGESFTFPSSPHATVVLNACAGCHMGDVREHDGYEVGGHTFQMIAESDPSITMRRFCADASCHPTADALDFTADADYDGNGSTDGYQTEIVGLTDSLRTLLVWQGVLDGTDHPVSGTIADEHLAGSLYNFLNVIEDRSKGVHNFSYIRSLLDASIAYVSAMSAPVPGNDNLDLYTSH